MSNFVKFILCVVAIILILKFIPHNENKNSPVATSSSSTIAPQAYVSSIAKIPADIVEYVKRSTMYGNYYNANKKFVIYMTGSNFPQAQAFISALTPIINDSSYQQYYNFVPLDINSKQTFSNIEDSQKYIDFESLCHEFCIVNPVSNELFYFDGIGEAEAAKLPTVFADLKNW